MFHHTGARKALAKNRKTETAAMTLQDCCKRLTDYLICVHIFIITVILPLYFREGYGYIATDKNLFFREACFNMGKALAPALAAYFILSVVVYFQTHSGGSVRQDVISMLRRKFCMIDIFAGVYGLALVLSYVCSDYREHARWGSSGWYMGFYPQVMLLCTYFLIAKLWKPRKAYFYIILAVSAVVFGLAYLNRFRIFPIEMKMRNPGFISTIGNINWYCGYAVTVFFAGAAFLWQGGMKKGWQKVLLILYVWLGFATLVTQGSASGIMTLGVVMFLLFLLSAGEGEKMCRFWMLTFLLGSASLFTQVWMLAAPGKMNYKDAIIDLMLTGGTPAVMTMVSLAAWQWLRSMVNVRMPGNITGQKGWSRYQKRTAETEITEMTELRDDEKLDGSLPANSGRQKSGSLAARRRVYPEKLFQTVARVLVITVSVSFAVFLVMIIINTLHPGSIGKLSEYSVFTFSDTWGSKRGATWKAGVRCFAEQNLLHKLVGVGPDAMEAFIYRDGSQGLLESLRTVFGNDFLTNAHNEWLTVLVNTGLLGLAGFGGMIVSAMRSFMEKIGKDPFIGACGISLFAYTMHNIFSFQQIMNVTSAFVILGMGAAWLREKNCPPAG